MDLSPVPRDGNAAQISSLDLSEINEARTVETQPHDKL